MTCMEFVQFLIDYYDGELPDNVRETFEAHMVKCPSCVAYLKTYEQTIRLGKGACRDCDDEIPPEVPEGLVQAILDARKTEK